MLLIACGGDGLSTPGAIRVSLTRGGGFTGGTRGCAVHSDGRALGWAQLPGAPADTLWRATLPAAVAQRRLRALAREVTGWPSQDTGNMTAMLHYTDDDTSWSRSWAGSALPTRAPAAVRVEIERLDSLCAAGQAIMADTAAKDID